MSKKKAWLVIDPQNDFMEGGSLAVPGAKNDMKLLARRIQQEANTLDAIFVTQDDHPRNHIANAATWYYPNSDDRVPKFSVVKRVGNRYYVNDNVQVLCTLKNKARVRQCFEKHGGQLMLWPDHCIQGTRGGEVYKPLQRVLDANSHLVYTITKGNDKYMEEFSGAQTLCVKLLSKEHPTVKVSHLAFDIYKRGLDELHVAGEAYNYCLISTVEDLVKQFRLICERNFPGKKPFIYIHETYTSCVEDPTGVRPNNILPDDLKARLQRIRSTYAAFKIVRDHTKFVHTCAAHSVHSAVKKPRYMVLETEQEVEDYNKL